MLVLSFLMLHLPHPAVFAGTVVEGCHRLQALSHADGHRDDEHEDAGHDAHTGHGGVAVAAGGKVQQHAADKAGIPQGLAHLHFDNDALLAVNHIGAGLQTGGQSIKQSENSQAFSVRDCLYGLLLKSANEVANRVISLSQLMANGPRRLRIPK